MNRRQLLHTLTGATVAATLPALPADPPPARKPTMPKPGKPNHFLQEDLMEALWRVLDLCEEILDDEQASQWGGPDHLLDAADHLPHLVYMIQGMEEMLGSELLFWPGRHLRYAKEAKSEGERQRWEKAARECEAERRRPGSAT